MFDMFLKPKFYTKCKSCVKLMKARLDGIRKKKNTILKFLKNDIVELLKSRLDYNAYNRAEGFLVERNILKCYDLIDEFCGTIFKQASVLNKQSECPDECKEAVASLIYAAARFADLPELRELRNLFTGKYGSSFEPFTNKEFIEYSRVTAHTKEMKLQLLQEIAQEAAIDWNSKALEQQLYTPPQDEHNGERSADNRNKTKVAFVPVHEKKSNSLRKKDTSDDDSIFDSRSEGNTTEASTGDSCTDQDVHKGVSEDEVEDEKPFYLRLVPPPYLKTRPIKREESVEEPRKVIDIVKKDESNKPEPKPTSEEKPKPRSVRRRYAKPQPARDINIDDVGSSAIDSAERISSSRNKGKETMVEEDKSLRGDDEERMLDGLLMRYSMKKTSHESNKEKGNLKFQRKQEKDSDEPQKSKTTKNDDAFGPSRAVSLPIDSTEPVKKHTRTNSFVHPKLPDCDELAARIAALKEK